MPLVSVVVPVYNMEETIGKCIESLLNTEYPNKEIIIIDDCSTDGTKRIISSYPVKVWRNEEKKGVSFSRNEGIELASGEIVAFTDADCFVDEKWLTYLTQHFDDLDVGGVGGKVVFLYNDRLTATISLEYKERFDRRRIRTESLSCINAAYRKDVLKRVNGFSRILGELVGGEDIELSYKVKEEGYRLVYEPKAVVKHCHTTMKFRSYLKKCFRNSVVSVFNYYKHRCSFFDSFFGWKLIVQPWLTALFLFSLVLLFLNTALYLVPLFMMGLCFMWHFPLSIKMVKETGSSTVWVYACTLFLIRGFVYAAGLIWGTLRLGCSILKDNLRSGYSLTRMRMDE